MDRYEHSARLLEFGRGGLCLCVWGARETRYRGRGRIPACRLSDPVSQRHHGRLEHRKAECALSGFEIASRQYGSRRPHYRHGAACHDLCPIPRSWTPPIFAMARGKCFSSIAGQLLQASIFLARPAVQSRSWTRRARAAPFAERNLARPRLHLAASRWRSSLFQRANRERGDGGHRFPHDARGWTD